jgi:hypothetical protein
MFPLVITAKNMNIETQQEDGEQIGSYRLPLPRRSSGVPERQS